MMSHTLGFLSKVCFPDSDSSDLFIVCNLDRLRISQTVKSWFLFCLSVLNLPLSVNYLIGAEFTSFVSNFTMTARRKPCCISNTLWRQLHIQVHHLQTLLPT